MIFESECIALRSVRYSDTRSIATCLVRGAGRMAFAVDDGAGREARRRRALMMPGSKFHALIDRRDNRTVQALRSPIPLRPTPTGSPSAIAITLFICDFTDSLLRDEAPDDALFTYVDTFLGLVAVNPHPNSTPAFLIGLTQLMGIAPDMTTWRPGSVLDLRDGTFRSSPPLSGPWLDAADAAYVRHLVRMTPRNLSRFLFTRQQRADLLDRLIAYFRLHLGTSSRPLRSLDVLRSLFL